MIGPVEIKERARDLGVPESTIERDYAQNWLLKALYDTGSEMVLKGGTGVKKVYVPEYRFSDDLDFTLLGEMAVDDLKVLISDTLTMIRKESGMDLLENFDIKQGVTGYVVRVYFRILRRTGHPLRIKLDLTNAENEVILMPPANKRIIHPYSDAISSKVKVYTLEEIVAEKIRSLFQRTRPRDLYDVWALWNRTAQEKVTGLFVEKCRFKELKPDLDAFVDRKDIFSNTWSKTLSHQMKALPDFEVAHEMVLRIIERVLA
jgi:predicted nucleotidyltransferase component of viral defense system